MTTFVGAEYVIANCLIANKPHRVTIEELNEVSCKLQQAANKENIDAIFLTSYDQIRQSLQDFSEYFTYNESTETIGIARGKDADDLEVRFMGYMPLKILCFIVEQLRK